MSHQSHIESAGGKTWCGIKAKGQFLAGSLDATCRRCQRAFAAWKKHYHGPR